MLGQRRSTVREAGFTLVEVMVTLLILSILMSIALPSYLGFKALADQRAASADVRAAIPDAEDYYNNNGTYSGMTVSSLLSIDLALRLDTVVVSSTGNDYCLQAAVGGRTAHFTRGSSAVDSSANQVVNGPCPSL
jgi:prepilin-type N-terminal cleavage/methylation domain-containing protein